MLIVWKGVALHDVLVEDGNEAAFSDSEGRQQQRRTLILLKGHTGPIRILLWFDLV